MYLCMNRVGKTVFEIISTKKILTMVTKLLFYVRKFPEVNTK